MHMFFDYSRDILVDFAVLAVLYGIIFFTVWKRKSPYRLFLNTVMYVYVALVLYVTLMPIVCSLPHIFDHPYVTMSMVPFEDYIMGRGNAKQQIVLNVLMMVPFGFLLPLLKKRSLPTVLFWTLLFSLSIELSQPLINAFRTADVTDLITNTIGGFLGYIFYKLLYAIQKIVRGTNQ